MNRSRNRSFKAALLGLDHPHSALYLNALLNRPEIASVSLWNEDPRPAALGALPRDGRIDRLTTNLDAVLTQGELDFAVVCVRTDRAAEIATRVVSAGRHLLVEKPGGLTPAEIRGVIRAARRSGVRASVAYVHRLQPAIRDARRMVASGTIGRMLSIEGRLLTTQVRFRDPRVWFFHRRYAGGGILTWLGCHSLDLMQHVSGERVVSVFAHEATLSGERIDVEDQASLALKFESGAIGTFNAGYALAHSGGGFVNSGGYDAYLAWNGQEGRIVWPGFTPRLHLESPVKRGSPVREKTYAAPATSSYGGAAGDAFLRQFLASLRGRAEPPAPLEDALRVAQVVEAAARSAATGRLVTVAP